MSAPLAGLISVTGSAQVLSSPVGVQAWVLKAPLTNSNPIFIGPSTVTTANGYQMDPGDTFEYERITQSGAPKYELGPADVYVVGTSGDKATWFASPA